MEGILTPFTKRLVNCCDTKPFLKWILIKPQKNREEKKIRQPPNLKIAIPKALLNFTYAGSRALVWLW